MGLTISKSVGKTGVNSSADVGVIQQLLNKFIDAKQLQVERLVTDNDCGPLTRNAIGLFQSIYLGHKKPDHRVDPNGQTLEALNGPPTQLQKGDPNDLTLQGVVEVLRSVSINAISFSLGVYQIRATDYRNVANQFAARRLRAYRVPELMDNAVYRHKNDDTIFGELSIGFLFATSALQLSTVVHEATHAVCDSWGRTMMVEESEAVAHLAQAIFHHRLTGRVVNVTHPGTQEVMKHCLAIAQRMASDRITIVGAIERQELMRLIRLLPTVSANAAFFYDGI